MTNEKTGWIYCGTLEQGGHRVFKMVGTDRLFLADRSGYNPDHCEGGRLELDLSRKLSSNESTHYSHVPVLQGEKPTWTLVGVEGTLKLIEAGMKFDFDTPPLDLG